MEAKLIDSCGTDLTPVNAARCSFNKTSDWDMEVRTGTDEHGAYTEYAKVLKEKDKKLIGFLARESHFAPFEHLTATLHLKVPIFIARQIQRHRTFSFSEVSRRYVDDAPEFYWPEKWRKRAENVKQGSSDEEVIRLKSATFENTPSGPWHDTRGLAAIVVSKGVAVYNEMLEAGVAPEQARMILPQNMYTEMWMSGDARAWSHFLKLRLDSHAQKEVQDIAKKIDVILRGLWPVSMSALMGEQDGN